MFPVILQFNFVFNIAMFLFLLYIFFSPCNFCNVCLFRHTSKTQFCFDEYLPCLSFGILKSRSYKIFKKSLPEIHYQHQHCHQQAKTLFSFYKSIFFLVPSYLVLYSLCFNHLLFYILRGIHWCSR